MLLNFGGQNFILVEGAKISEIYIVWGWAKSVLIVQHTKPIYCFNGNDKTRGGKSFFFVYIGR